MALLNIVKKSQPALTTSKTVNENNADASGCEYIS
jgi:hypothetical protein